MRRLTGAVFVSIDNVMQAPGGPEEDPTGGFALEGYEMLKGLTGVTTTGVDARIADLIPNRSRSHLVPYNTTELERDVAISLGIPMYGADPRLADRYDWLSPAMPVSDPAVTSPSLTSRQSTSSRAS